MGSIHIRVFLVFYVQGSLHAPQLQRMLSQFRMSR